MLQLLNISAATSGRIICSGLFLNGAEYLFCAAEVLLHIAGAGFGSRGQCVGIGKNIFEGPFFHVVSAVDAPASATGYYVVRLLELAVVGAEEDGLAEGDGLEDVVDAHAEAAADLSYVGIAVELRQKTDVVDDENLFGV